MNRAIKKHVKTKGVKIEDQEARAFDRAYLKLHERFNNFLFDGAPGSFVEFDIQYRALAAQGWRYIQPDPNDFFKFAILK